MENGITKDESGAIGKFIEETSKLKMPYVSTFLKRGSIRHIDEKEIYCILQKDFELDHELTLERSLLTDKQNEIASLGLIVRYNFNNGVIEFMLKDGNWC